MNHGDIGEIFSPSPSPSRQLLPGPSVGDAVPGSGKGSRDSLGSLKALHFLLLASIILLLA